MELKLCSKIVRYVGNDLFLGSERLFVRQQNQLPRIDPLAGINLLSKLDDPCIPGGFYLLL